LIYVMNRKCAKTFVPLLSMNLLKQAPEAILIPEEINIDLIMIKPDIEFDPNTSTEIKATHRIHIGRVFTISRATIARWQQSTTQLPAEKLHIPRLVEENYQPLFLTHIQLDKAHDIEEGESGLTQPIGTIHIEGSIKAGSEIQYFYELGKHPGLKGFEITKK